MKQLTTYTKKKKSLKATLVSKDGGRKAALALKVEQRNPMEFVMLFGTLANAQKERTVSISIKQILILSVAGVLPEGKDEEKGKEKAVAAPEDDDTLLVVVDTLLVVENTQEVLLAGNMHQLED